MAAAVGAPAALLATFAFALLWLKYTSPGAKGSSTPAENWALLRLANVAVGLSNANVTCIVAAAMLDPEAGILAGTFWAGIYALGSVFSLPFFLRLGPGRAIGGLALHGVASLLGNGLAALGLHVGDPRLLLLGRLLAGFEFGVNFFADILNTHLTHAGADRAHAVMATRVPNALGQSCGFLAQPTASGLVLGLLPSLSQRLSLAGGRHCELVPHFLMVCYAAGLLMFLLLLRPASPTMVEDPSQDSTGGLSGASSTLCHEAGDKQHQRELWWDTLGTFAVCAGTSFSRSLAQNLAEAVITIVLTYQFCVPTAVTLALLLVRLSVVVSRALLLRIRADITDAEQYLKYVEVAALVCQPCLCWTLGASNNPVALAAFLLGRTLQLSASGLQGGAVAAVAAQKAIATDPVLNNRMLSLLVFVCGNVCSWFTLPIINYGIARAGQHHQATSLAVGALGLAHALSTVCVVSRTKKGP